MQKPRPEMSGEEMRQYLAEVGARVAERGLTGPRNVQILLESLFE